MTRAEQILPSPRTDPYGDSGPSVAVPPLRCWRCGEPSTGVDAAFNMICVKGRDVPVHADGCVPTIPKETR